MKNMVIDDRLLFFGSLFNFTAGRPNVAFLFWFLGDFRCGVLLFMIFFVIYKY